MKGARYESAIPEHLRVPRTCPMRIPKQDYEPPFAARTTRFPLSVKEFVIAIIGAQHSTPASAAKVGALSQILVFIKKDLQPHTPRHWDAASVTDAQGAYNECVIAYWDDNAAYTNWRASSGFDAWWTRLEPGCQNGWYMEVFLPSIDRVETIFGDLRNHPEGIGHLSKSPSDFIREHVYWGSMRDRLPLSQTDEMVGECLPPLDTSCDTRKARVCVPGKRNLCMIRSGQDWSSTTPEERKLYLETLHPVLIQGMDFLRDNGEQVGCYSCRHMDVLNSETLETGTEKTFGLAYFDDIASLEGWSKGHKTHLDIFGGFLKYTKRLNNHVTLRLYHEVMVLKPEQQYFEYVGCHGKTGMLGGLDIGQRRNSVARLQAARL